MTNESTKVSRQLQSVGTLVDKTLEQIAGKRVSFSLFVWTDGRTNYISNSSSRQEIKSALQAIIDGWDDGMPDIPAHEVT